MENVNNAKDNKNKVLILCFIAVLVALTSVKYYKKYYAAGQMDKKGKTFQTSFNFSVSDNKNEVELKALNGYINIKGYEGSEIVVNAEYVLKEDGYKLDFYKDKKKGYIVDFDATKFKEVSLDVLVPFNHFKNIEVLSFDSKVEIENLKAKDLSLKSSNGEVYIESFEGEEIQIENLNKNVFIENSSLEDLNIQNMNGEIKIDNCDIKYIEGTSLNGNIEIFKDEPLSVYDNYKWDIQNQNGNIIVELLSNNINYNIDAKAYNGTVDIKKDNLEYINKKINDISAKTQNPDKSYKSLNLSLETSNSSIILK